LSKSSKFYISYDKNILARFFIVTRIGILTTCDFLILQSVVEIQFRWGGKQSQLCGYEYPQEYEYQWISVAFWRSYL